jgi:hypothetical protein
MELVGSAEHRAAVEAAAADRGAALEAAAEHGACGELVLAAEYRSALAGHGAAAEVAAADHGTPVEAAMEELHGSARTYATCSIQMF